MHVQLYIGVKGSTSWIIVLTEGSTIGNLRLQTGQAKKTNLFFSIDRRSYVNGMDVRMV